MTLHPLRLRGQLGNLGDQTPLQPQAPGSGLSLQAPLNELCVFQQRVWLAATWKTQECGSRSPEQL